MCDILWFILGVCVGGLPGYVCVFGCVCVRGSEEEEEETVCLCECRNRMNRSDIPRQYVSGFARRAARANRSAT